MKIAAHKVLACLLLGSTTAALAQANATAPSSPTANQIPVELEQRMESISAALAVTQQQLIQSQRQMEQLQHEIIQLRQQMASTSATSVSPSTSESSSSNASSSSVNVAATSDATAVTAEERLQTLEAAVKLHDQTKVESNSKYRVRLNGLILFNGFLNKGLPDNIDLPTVALRETSTSGNGSLGASLRQTILGVEGDGPRIGGARTSANVSFDFFSGLSYTSYGTAAGQVRLRTGSINFDWAKDAIELGMVTPLISPLSPTSYATVAEPSLASAGNLWTWAPQLEYAHRFAMQEGKQIKVEVGLWDSPSAGYNPNQFFRTASPAELAEQPAYETLVSYGATGDRGLLLGVGGYYSRQAYPGYLGYPGTENLDSWAGTAVWRIPFARHFEISGEGYRGRAIGGLGGGLYKDVVTGTDPISGANVLHGLNAAGGWTQFKTRFSQSLETNFSIGQDDGFARDFHAVVLSPTATATQLRARNRMVVANLIYRPKTYIILSPEFRQIWTWPISGAANTVDVYTLSVGYQF